MSLLLEIATRADVPLEAVVRVLTREPVSAAVKGRVLDVLDDLEPEETRVLQRFALAAVHDVLPRPADHEVVVGELLDDPLELPEKVTFELEAGEAADEYEDEGEEVAAETTLPATIDPAPLVQLGSVLGELTEAVRELRYETDAERRERVDDLAVLIDLITKGWEGVDRRLGRVERQLGRLESAPPQEAIAAHVPQRHVEPPPVPAPEPPPPPPEDLGDGERSALRQRLPLIAALAFGIAVGAVAALDLPSRFDAAAVISERGSAEAAQQARLPATVADQRVLAPPVTLTAGGDDEDEGTPARRAPGRTAPTRSAPARTTPARPAPGPTTTARTTTAAATRTAPAAPRTQRPAPPGAPATTQRATTARAVPATTAASRTTAPPAPTIAEPAFTPSRNWAWPPVAGADYYLVEFLRDGRLLHRARPTAAKLTLPDSVVFTPGRYRWRVLPGHGDPAANRLDPPIVDSEFLLER
jgi:hypothetical protein